jgi:hypothetical protein
MAFPTSPTDGQTYTQYGRTFIYSSTTGAWRNFKNSDLSNPLTGNVTLGTISNVHISGGTSGQLISTDGSGNLSFATVTIPDTMNPFLLAGM